MKAKINKKKLIICIVALITLITLPAFGRYIYNSVRDLYLKVLDNIKLVMIGSEEVFSLIFSAMLPDSIFPHPSV